MDLFATQPANVRPIRVGGLMRCCTSALKESIRHTEIGSEFQCPICKTTIVVDQRGCWLWGPARNLIVAQKRGWS